MAKTNPRRRPATEADCHRAWEQGVLDGVSNACAILLTVLADKFDGGDYIPNIWAEVNKLSEEIKERRVSVADLRPVMRGKWSIHEIYKHEMSYGVTGYEPVYKCSVCGRLMESYLRFDEPIMPEDADFPRFCPNCGADMREEK